MRRFLASISLRSLSTSCSRRVIPSRTLGVSSASEMPRNVAASAAPPAGDAAAVSGRAATGEPADGVAAAFCGGLFGAILIVIVRR